MNHTHQQSKIVGLAPWAFLMAVVAIFLGFKINHVSLPFFWDESWVYGPAVRSMGRSELSLLPGALPVDLSRGHPLLFHFLAGLWSKVFGLSLTSLHCFALFISASTVYIFCRIIEHLFDVRYALLAVPVFISQPIFLAQSTLVLPEMLLTLFSLGSISAAINHRWIMYIICASLAIWTKETGIIIPIAVCIVWIGSQSLESLKGVKALQIFLLILSPLLTFALFLILQYLEYGWFLYPDHVGSISFDPNSFISKLGACLSTLLIDQNRWVLTTLSIFCWVLVFRTPKNLSKGHKTILSYCASFISLLIIFSSLNFYSARYLLAGIPFYLIFILLPIYILSKQSPIRLILISILVSSVFLYEATQKKSIRDVNLSYVPYCLAQKDAVNFLEQNTMYNAHIRTGFLMESALNIRDAGYRSTPVPFNDVNDWSSNRDTTLYIFYPPEIGSNYREIKESDNTEMIFRTEEGVSWFEIYRYIQSPTAE